MKILRSIRTQAACALLLAAGVGGLVALSYLDEPSNPAPDNTPRQARVEAPAIRKRASNKAAEPDARQANHGANLRLDDAAALAPTPPAESSAESTHADITAHGVDAAEAGDFVESDADTPGLNLQMPAESDVATLVEDEASREKNAVDDTRPATSNITLNAEGEIELTPEVESFNIFNPEYGLRGFMKQGWINQRVAFQGGLGLDDDRIDKAKNDDLRDNIAVGMGLILAF